MWTFLAVLATGLLVDRFWRHRMHQYIRHRDMIEGSHEYEVNLALDLADLVHTDKKAPTHDG